MNGAREGDARKEGSFPGGIYDVTLTGHWLKRLLAVVEVPCSQTAAEAEGQSVCPLEEHDTERVFCPR